MDSEQEDRTLMIIMGLSVLGLIDSLYLSYLHHIVSEGAGCPLLLPLVGLIGSAFGTYLTYAEAFIIRQWCPFCLIAFGLTLGATFFAFRTYSTELMDFIRGKNGI